MKNLYLYYSLYLFFLEEKIYYDEEKELQRVTMIRNPLKKKKKSLKKKKKERKKINVTKLSSPQHVIRETPKERSRSLH